MNYYVEASAVKNGNGSRETPFRTIGEAARIARPGDTVIVGPGIYREYVDPANGGTQEHPIVYRSERKGGAHITGAEPVKNWEKLEGNVWMARIPNGVFGEYNPFETLVAGDWYIALKPARTGDIFLDERSMYEVQDLESVKDPKVSEASWEPEFSLYTWYTEQDKQKNETILYAANRDYDGFSKFDLEFRELLDYPPYTHLITVFFRGEDESKLAEYASAFTAEVNHYVHDEIRIAGPSPAPIERIKGKFRYMLVIRGRRMKILKQALRVLALHRPVPKGIDVYVDVDAQSLL